MSEQRTLATDLLKNTQTDADILNDTEVAHLVLHENSVIGSNTVPGLDVQVKEMEEGVDVAIEVAEKAVIEKTVHLCFGVIPESGVQKIGMKVNAHAGSRIAILAHCVFPNAIDVKHIMDATIHLGQGAEYSYLEKHVHGAGGGIKVYPRAVIQLDKGARFSTEFELIKGRVGLIDIDYETTAGEDSVLEMTARISGRADDHIKIRETGHLEGARARGALVTKIAVRDNARAEIYNKLTASAPFARGHVDCKEIVQDRAVATATPIVEVNDPRAHVTHEAAIGSVDNKQLETLMARGLSEDEAVEMIIDGMLRK
jgi:hypothetical protein